MHVGQNNIDTQADTNVVQYEKQLRYEVGQLTQELSGFVGAVKVVKVPESQVALTSEATEKMLGTINNELDKMVAALENGVLIEVSDELGDDKEAWSDYRHYSEEMCAKVLDTIDNSFPDDQKFLIRGKNSTTSRKYAKVNSSYKLGCGVCTRLGHSEDKCKSQAGAKRANVSGSTPPAAKQGRH